MTKGPAKTSAWVALFGTLALGLLVTQRKLADPDLPWHLATGKVVSALGKMPERDVLAFTERPVRYVEVVSDVLLYQLVRIGGPTALQVFAGILAVAIALLLWIRTRRFGPIAFLVTALAVTSMGPWLMARPATLAFVLLALTLVAIDVHRKNAGHSRGRWALALLLPLHALFANVHGFVVLGCALTLAYALHRTACKVAAGRVGEWLPRKDGAEAGKAALSAVGTIVASGLNPLGFQLLLGPGAALRDHTQISEWRPPSFELLWEFDPAALILALVLLVALFVSRNGRAIPLFDLGVALGGLALGATAVRLVPIGALFAAPLVAERLAPFVRDLPRVRLLTAASTLLVAPVLAIDPGFSLGRGFDLGSYPEGATRYVETANLRGRMWNHLPYGGWLAWRLYPDRQVMVDGRTGWVHDPALVERAIASETDGRALSELSLELDFSYAITRATEGLPFGNALGASITWQLVFLDENSAVYVQSAEPQPEAYRLIRHTMNRASMLALAKDPNRSAELMHDARRALSQAPNSGRAAFLLGAAAIAGNDSAELERAKQLLRDDPASVRELDSAWSLAHAPPLR